MKGAGMWKLAVWSVAATTLMLLAASGSGLNYYVHRRVLLAQPAELDTTRHALLQAYNGRVGGGPTITMRKSSDTAYKRAWQRCRPPATGSPPLPKLRRIAAWPGSNPSKAGNTTVVTTLHVDRLPLLEAHCAVWPHTIAAAVYVPVTKWSRVMCLSQPPTEEELHRGNSWLAWLGLGAGDCQYAGWSVARLRSRVRSVQKRAQKIGLCNLQVQLFTEEVTEEMGPAAGLLPQAALQNKVLLSLKPEEAEEHHAVVLLDSDTVSVDAWQLVNWPSRWERALREMSAGKTLVLPAFQLSPAGAATAAKKAKADIHPEAAVMQAAVSVITAESGKFPLKKLFDKGQVQVLLDRGFVGSQDAALPTLWFEAGDMHSMNDDGYLVKPKPGFAPFVMMLQRHVPWADERIRGSYYHRAWQALAAASMGMQHLVQPNTFSMQLPHAQAYSTGEAALANFQAVEPTFKQLVNEVGAGEYVPVTSFAASQCALQDAADDPDDQGPAAEAAEAGQAASAVGAAADER